MRKLLRVSLALLVLAAAKTPAQTEWTVFGAPPRLGSGPSMVHDGARARTLLLWSTQTWAHDGFDWRLQQASGPFPQLFAPGLAYDSRREVVVLFGGDSSNRHNVTWEWDGTSWTQAPATMSPSARWMCQMVYDSRRGVTVLYGGFSANGRLRDTWEYDGVDWVLRQTTTTPPASIQYSLTYDESRGVCVLFGGMDASGSVTYDQTWEYDGVDWTRRQPATVPPARRSAGLAYDSVRQRCVLAGGAGASGRVIDPTLVWEWDGADWSSVQAANGPPAGLTSAMTYDAALGQCLFVPSGVDWVTWGWDGAQWSVVNNASLPPLRDRTMLVTDWARDSLVMFGGSFALGSAPDDATWVRKGGFWSRVQPSTVPTARDGNSGAYDAVNDAVLMFGGTTGRQYLGDTWHWDGVDWRKLNPQNSPAPRVGAAMALDTARQRIVLFGGQDVSGAWTDDTWEWDGTDWLRRNPANRPPPRANHAMAYDAPRRETVMFGGGDFGRGPSLGDHWSWDGNDWTQVTPATLPPTRAGHGMVFDPDRDVVVMHAGYEIFAIFFPYSRYDNWEWDGVDWTQRTTAVMPAAKRHHAMAWDPLMRRSVLFGNAVAAPETAEYGPASVHEIVGYGTACRGTRGDLELQAVGTPRRGNSSFGVRLTSARPRATVALAAGARAAAVPFPGSCTLLVDQPELFTATASAVGAALFEIPIPNAITLRGRDVFLQGIAVDPGGPLEGLASMSAGLRLRVD